jgi:hypothetical protein
VDFLTKIWDWFNGKKVYLGLAFVAFYVITMMAFPWIMPVIQTFLADVVRYATDAVDQILNGTGIIGTVLLLVGIIHKAIKLNAKKGDPKPPEKS